jgi:hypothetical protein
LLGRDDERERRTRGPVEIGSIENDDTRQVFKIARSGAPRANAERQLWRRLGG